MGEDQDETDKPETGGSSGETSQPATPTPAPPQKQPDESTAVTAWVNTASGSLNLRYSPGQLGPDHRHYSPVWRRSSCWWRATNGAMWAITASMAMS